MKRHAISTVAALLVVGCSAGPQRNEPTVVQTPTHSEVMTSIEPDRTEVKLADLDLSPAGLTHPDSHDTTSNEAIANALTAKSDAYVTCYKQALGQGDVQGRIEVELDLQGSGAVQSVRTFPDTGLDGLAKCVEATIREVQVTGVNTANTRVVWALRFNNPVTTIGVTNAFAIVPPAPVRRARRGRHAAPEATATTTTTTPPADATGPLTADEIASTITANAASMQTCLATLLATQKGTTGTGQLRLDVALAGTVTKAELVELNVVFAPQRRSRRAPAVTPDAARDAFKSCVEQGAQALHFRGSSGRSAVTMPVTFGAPARGRRH